MYCEESSKIKENLMCSSFTNSLMFGFSQFVVFIIYAVLFYSGGSFIRSGYIDLRQMMSAIFTILFAAFGLGQSQQYIKDYAASKDALVSLNRILDTKSEIDPLEKRDSVKIESEKLLGKIEFKNVSFSYPTRKNEKVFTGLSFTIEPGQAAAFVGYSGCGKSTIIQLIERFYDVDEGEILIDGVNIKDYDLISLRKCVGLVLQEPCLFKTTIEKNIKYGKLNASNEEVDISVKKAYISELYEKSKHSDLPVSGGQKQRIAIARSIVKNPKILLLDEATSALDKDSEEIVQKAIEEMMIGKTSITIAHRLSTIKNSNVIFYMESGEIKRIWNS